MSKHASLEKESLHFCDMKNTNLNIDYRHIVWNISNGKENDSIFIRRKILMLEEVPIPISRGDFNHFADQWRPIWLLGCNLKTNNLK